MAESLLSVEDLHVSFPGAAGVVAPALTGVSFDVHEDETLAIVGESGSGKSVLALTAVGLMREPGARIQGRVVWRGDDVISGRGRRRWTRRGGIALLLPDSLHPLYRVGAQLSEAVRFHRGGSSAAARDRAIDLLEAVGVAAAHRRVDAYPHQLPDGIRQRAMIARALAGEPELLIADEPTAGLDLTIQAGILALLRDLTRRGDLAIVISTRDVRVAVEIADSIIVLEGGCVVERGPARQVLAGPEQPGTGALVRSVSWLGAPRGAPRPVSAHASEAPLIQVRDLVKHFPLGGEASFRRRAATVRAVDGISFDVMPGETLGVVGEAGCGKSTLGRVLVGLLEATAGQILFEGEDIAPLRGDGRMAARRNLQMVSGDPHSSLNPKRRVGAIIAEPLAIHGLRTGDGERRRRAQELMDQVGLNPEHVDRYPNAFSTQERERIAVARAIALEPRALVVDELPAGLEEADRAEILGLLSEVQQDTGLTLILITRDPSAVHHRCDRLLVMCLGKLAELASDDDLYSMPRHPYTGALLSAVPALARPRAERDRPRAERDRPRADREVSHAPTVAAENQGSAGRPGPGEPPPACRFYPRCPKAQELCAQEEPVLERRGAGGLAACHFPLSPEEIRELLPLGFHSRLD